MYNKACSHSRQRRYSRRRELNSVQSFDMSVQFRKGALNEILDLMQLTPAALILHEPDLQ